MCSMATSYSKRVFYSILVFSVFAYLGPLLGAQRATLHTTLLDKNFEEISENHLDNTYYASFCGDSRSLNKVSP